MHCMETRILHGKITPQDLAEGLVAAFSRGNYRVQQIGSGEKISIQIATREWVSAGGQTALSVTLQQVEDGVSVQIGQQAWMGVAASLGLSALAALQNPWAIISRIDDIAQDIEHIQLTDAVWQTIETNARALGAGFELSERLRRLTCAYCQTANPVGESRCIACGAPLGSEQPKTCQFCGFVMKQSERICPNCRHAA